MRDPGLQPERTSLAWARTNFLLFVVALLFIREAILNDKYLYALAAVILCFIGSSNFIINKVSAFYPCPDTLGKYPVRYFMILAYSASVVLASLLFLVDFLADGR